MFKFRLPAYAVAFYAGSCVMVIPLSAPASDHDDTPLLKTIPRHDPRITDLHVFTRGNGLVLSLCLDPTVPPAATEYAFAPDLEIKFSLDRNTEVRFDDPEDLAEFGGTIVRPHKIKADITFEVTFSAEGVPHLEHHGLPAAADPEIQFFAGFRDDPFIRGPRIGRNVAALVIELPMRWIRARRPRPILVWATSRVSTVSGPMVDLAGRSLRSQFVENDLLNTRSPDQHASDMGMTPDVVIFDPRRPAAFPNGRELTDDVVDLVADPRVLANDTPFPTANDVPFLDEFPYLAPPHAP